MLTSTELREKLGIPQTTLTAWVRAGLPWEGTKRRKLFDLEQVRDWGIANGKIRPVDPPPDTGPVFDTRAELARELNVAERTIATWCTYPDFPGRPGHQGRREAFYPLNDIIRWHAKTFGDVPMEGARNSARERKDNAQAELAELELAERRGELIPLDDVLRFYTRQMAQAKTHMWDLADKVLSRLPPKIKKDERAEIRKVVDEIRDDVLQTFVELLKGDTDPTDED